MASGAQPILAAIELIAADWEACSPWWSNTIRTARARTSGEYGGMRLVMAPSFQDQEPPENPVRFPAPLPAAADRGRRPPANHQQRCFGPAVLLLRHGG